MNNYVKGVLLIIASALFFTISATIVKYLGDVGVYSKAFYRSIFGTIIVLGFIAKSKTSLKVNKQYHKTLFLRCLFGFLGMISYYYAIDNMILSDATMINKLNPFFVLVLSSIFLKESLNRHQIFAIIIAFIGALFVIKPSFDLNFLPSLAALGSALFAGSAYTTVRSLSGKIKPLVMVFYFTVFTSISTFVLMLFNEGSIPTLNEFILLILMSVSATFAQTLMTYAYRYAEASRLSIYNYASIVFAVITTYVVFSTFPDIYSIIGGLLIILSGYYNYRMNVGKNGKIISDT